MNKGYQKSTIYSFEVLGIEFQTEGYQIIALDELSLRVSYHCYGELMSGILQKMLNKNWIYHKGTEIEEVDKTLAKQVLEYINNNAPPKKEE